MEDQASQLQLDLIDNGLSHNGNNLATIEISDSFQSQKNIDHSMDVDVSNGINLLDAASSTTTETVSDQTSNDIKKVQNSSNGVEQTMATETIDNHQDDDLIRELEQFEGSKKDDDVTLSLPKSTTEENGSKLQDTSDLLKDLESDSPCPGPSESEIEITAIDSIVSGALVVDQIKKPDDVQVDSTTESSNKRKCSMDSFVESIPKRANMDKTTEKPTATDVSNTDTQKSTSEIDSDTESKLLQENSDGEASMSDVVEAITSTSTVTKTTNDVTSDVKLVDKTKQSNEDLVVSSSGNEVAAKVGSTKDVKKAEVSKGTAVNIDKSTESKGDDEVSSNKMNDTTEVMEQDLNETLEADCISEKGKNPVGQNTSSTSVNALPTSKSPVKNQLGSPELDSKTSETVVSSQADPVVSSEPKPSQMEIDTESEPQSDDVTQKHNGLTSASAESKTNVDNKNTSDSVSETLPDSGKVEAISEPIPIERIFEIRVFYEADELKSMTVERLEKKSAQESASVDVSSEPTKHTANGVMELCNYMIDHFSAMKKSLNVDDNSSPKASSHRGKGSSKKSATQTASPSQVTPKSVKRSSTSKRSLDKAEIDESESKSKQAKNSASEKSTSDEVEVTGDCCLARWTDRKYYAGRVIDEKPGNKFSVLFEDGAMKTLAAEVIVFGTGNVLPLMDHSVHVLVSDDTYEPGLVTKIETEDDEVKYTVAAESKIVTCSASNIYLMDDQAKVIHNSIKSKEVLMKTPETPSSKRTGRLPAKLEETMTTMSGGRSSRGKKGQPIVSPEPGFSGDIDTKKSGRRSAKRPPTLPLVRLSESSDLSDPLEDLPRLNSDTALEAISGVQPELQNTRKDSQIYKQNLIAEYLDNDPTQSFDDLLGPMPKKDTLFKGLVFILTCTIPMKSARSIETNSSQFGSVPFFKDHLRSQIELGGGTVYRFFEEIPKARYRTCKLIAHHPCTTAKYVQCLAANITPVSHEWIIECCTKNEHLNFADYTLPSGWSLTDEHYIDWKVSRAKKSRNSIKALKKITVLMASLQEDFSTFWQRVCKLSGSDTSVVESLDDIEETTKGFILTDEDCSEEIKSKAEHYKIPVVSTVWVVQSLIVGCPIDPESNPKLKMAYVDEDF